MKTKSADDILGLEFDWIASDDDGNVALFSTAGGGYAPEEFLRNTESHDAAIDAILALPPCTRARFAPQLRAGFTNTWQLVAERGLFAFDSDAHGGPYRLVAAPEVPVRTVDLPDTAASVVSRLVLKGMRFSELREVSKDVLARYG